MNDNKLLALYGLKWNPFLPNIPVEALWPSPGIDAFFFRVENRSWMGASLSSVVNPASENRRTFRCWNIGLSVLETWSLV